MPNLDDTHPAKKPAETLPPPAPEPTQAAQAPDFYEIAPEYIEEESGPGCLAWGLVGFMSVLLAAAIVIVAVFAAFTDGVDIGRANATATREGEIAAQCEQIPNDIANANVSLLQRRYDDLARDGALPACAAELAPRVTQVFIDSQATNTPTPTPFPTNTAIPQLTLAPTSAATPLPDANAANNNQFDPAPLLVEAQTFLGEGNFAEAIETLDAIIAIDPNFQSGTVNGLLFNALTSEATRLFRTGGSLSEAIILAQRAQNFGDIGDLGGEVTAAEWYLNAQPNIDINYPEAIRWLQQLTNLYPNYRDARQQLIEQYEGYGDAFAIGGEPCRAVEQYDAALALVQTPAIVTKRDEAQAACSGIAPLGGATADPNATPDPAGTPVVQPTATEGIAPIGQPGT